MESQCCLIYVSNLTLRAKAWLFFNKFSDLRAIFYFYKNKLRVI